MFLLTNGMVVISPFATVLFVMCIQLQGIPYDFVFEGGTLIRFAGTNYLDWSLCIGWFFGCVPRDGADGGHLFRMMVAKLSMMESCLLSGFCRYLVQWSRLGA